MRGPIIGALLSPIAKIARNRSFNVSSMVHADSCLLRTVLSCTEPIPGTLPSGCSALIGRVVHRVLEESATGLLSFVPSPRDSVLARLEELFATEGIALSGKTGAAAIAGCLGLSPKEGHRLVMRTIQGAVKVHSTFPRPITNQWGRDIPEHFHYSNQLRPGAEVFLCDEELDLKGRIDRLERLDSRSWLITDFKTYSLKAFATNARSSSSLPSTVRIQLELYALLIDRIEPGCTITAKAIGIDGSISTMKLTAAVLKERREWFMDVAAKMPRYSNIEPATLASPGPGCKGCSLRPRCSAYAGAALGAWASKGLQEGWPLDIWGTLERIEVGRSSLMTLRLLDQAGRNCRIEGLCSANVASHFYSGDKISLFNLGAYLPAATNSSLRHPLNFFEIPSQPHLRIARNVAIFSGCPEII